MSTLPHERELIFLEDAIDDSLKGRNRLIVIVAETQEQIRWFADGARRIVESLPISEARRVSIFREALEFDTGAKIVFMSLSYPQALRGLSPDKIVVVGRTAEFWYLALSTGAEIEAVA